MSMKLPFELVEIIIGHVAESTDLLSFSLTCKSLAGVILPYHLFYHTVNAAIYRAQIWLYFMMNPHLCRYVRRLEVSTSNNRKMRLSDAHVQLEVGHQIPFHTIPARPSQELFIQALYNMVNLRAFVWRHDYIPIIFESTKMAEKFPNLHFRGPKRLRCASAFDTPIVNQLCRLVSITLESDVNPSDFGRSILTLLGACHELKYLRLSAACQSLAEELVASCRWPNLEVLSLTIHQDLGLGNTWTKETIQKFFEFHSNIICLKWNIDFHNLYYPPTAIFPPGCFSRLKALEADVDFVRSIVTAPCTPPRSLTKILNFPIDEELWTEPEVSFQGIDRSSLRIISFNPNSLSQLTDLGRFFPSVECVDISNNSLSDVIWDADMGQFRKAMIAEYAEKLSSFRQLKFILGIHFFNESESEEENQRRLDWIDEIFPRLEFCADDSPSGASLIRDGGSTRLEFLEPIFQKAQSTIYSRYDRDFTIPEEYDHNVL